MKMKAPTTQRSPLGSDNCSPSLVWKPITEEPTEHCGWYAAAVNPVNADELDAAGINSWRVKFGFTKVWYNKPGKSSPGTWWEPDPHGQRSQPIGHRMTHWAELPPVPLIPENAQALPRGGAQKETTMPKTESPRLVGSSAIVLPVRLGEHPTRYHNWKSHFDGWTKREEEIAHAAYIAGWYHRCNQDPDAMGENSQALPPAGSGERPVR